MMNLTPRGLPPHAPSQARSSRALTRIGGLLAVAAAVTGLLTVAASPAQAAAVIPVFAGGSIQNAINAANPGDTIRVYPGTYNENLDFLGKAITVTAAGNPSNTIIDGQGRAPVASFVRNEGPASKLSGFTLRNGRDPFEGGGVHIENASPTVTGNVIRDNHSCSGSGLSAASSSALISANTITANTQDGCFGGSGGGVYVRAAGAVELRGNVITANRAESGGGIHLFAAGRPILVNNVISANKATWSDGGGVLLANVSDAVIVQNLFSGNAANFGRGGAISWLVPQGAAGPTVTSNTFAANAAASGAAVYADGFQAQVLLTNNVMTANAGLALACGPFGGQVPVFANNDVWSQNGGWDPACGAQNNRNGNRSVNPGFVDPVRLDLHLAAGSLLIDAGTNAVAGLPASDLDGRGRIRDGDGNGVAVIDMGAYER